VGDLLELDVGGLLALDHGVVDAVTHMVVQQAEGDVAQGRVRGTDLGEDVDAVLLLVDHPVNPADLALDALEPGLEAFLLLDVAVVRVGVVGVDRVRVVVVGTGVASVVVVVIAGSGGGGGLGHELIAHESLLVRSWAEANRRSRRELLTTKTLENAMAIPASIGLSRPIAATGMSATL